MCEEVKDTGICREILVIEYVCLTGAGERKRGNNSGQTWVNGSNLLKWEKKSPGDGRQAC